MSAAPERLRPLSPALRALPRRAVSRWLGQLGRLRLPRAALGAFLRWYVRTYAANLEEAARPLSSYATFVDFFTRRLQHDARPLPQDATAVVSPADGRVVAAGGVHRGTLLQVKGVPYSLATLLGDVPAAASFDGGSYLTVYLAPGDYHRFHWPLTGTLHSIRHVPGDLWPVNARAVHGVPGLFVKNERVVLLGHTPSRHPFAVVPVGALNVGSIRLTALPALRTNRSVLGPRSWGPLALDGQRGDELGWFEFGSSIVLLLSPGAGRLNPAQAGAALRMGQPIGRVEPGP